MTPHIDPFLITPGIRLPDGDTHDQKHVATPIRARQEGSNMIVVGRAIRSAPDPGQAAADIKEMLR
jgi:orotidine-5'-phosphate decarboxylase